MNRILNSHFVIPTAILLVGFWVMLATQKGKNESSERRFSERVNLALRQTAHHLLASIGDRTSKIPPVQQVGSNTWIVRLEQNFDYDSLPPILQKSFSQHHVEGEYNVAVLDCRNDELVLGYSFNPLAANTETPCGGREQTAGCYNLRVSFIGQSSTLFQEKSAWIFFGVFCFGLFAYSGYKFFISLKKKNLSQKTLQTNPAIPAEKALRQETISNQSTLYIDNQKLVVKGVEKDLTYRETKLLQLFCRHANQLLERDTILKLVWEDEGIIVGRSVDVFVSRLRKLLKDDEWVKIANVHGVGYRLEIKGH